MLCRIRVLLLFGCLVLTQSVQAQTTSSAGLRKFDSDVNNCDAFYPTKLRQAGVDGVTTLSLRVLIDGSLADVAVLKSSGNSDLDSAALKCAALFKHPPITSGGRPVEVRWQGDVSWEHLWPHVFVAIPVATICPVEQLYPPRAIRLNEEGKVVLTYRIEPDGTVGDLAITQSSGYPDLDQASIDCTKLWHFPPALENGKPIPIDRRSAMTWTLSG